MLAIIYENSDTGFLPFNDFIRQEFHYPPVVAQLALTDSGSVACDYLTLPGKAFEADRALTKPVEALTCPDAQHILAIIATQYIVDIYGSGVRQNNHTTPSLVAFLKTAHSEVTDRSVFVKTDLLKDKPLPKPVAGIAKFILANADTLEPSVGQAARHFLEPLRF